MEFDYIIVGAGSAGCVLANRLTADGKHNVLLLEAGRASHPVSRIPISYGLLINNPSANWLYQSEPEPGTKNRNIPVPRGKLLGGSSAINGLVYVRGQRLDYDTWAQLGNRGWSYDDVLPYFRKLERYEGGTSGGRGGGGPVRVSEAPDKSPLYDALFAAGEQCGLQRNADYNLEDQEGMVKTQTTISRGRRQSTAYAYLKPARARRNLQIETNALASRILIEGKRATGVVWRQGGQERRATARREVIVAAGGVAAPQLLELSGIGQPERLKDLGIEVAHELPGVGENLRDHIAPRMKWRITQPRATYNDRARGLGLVWQVLKYGLTGTGFLNLPSAPMLAFARTRPELESPDVQIHFVPFSYNNPKERKLEDEPGMLMTVYQLRPESTGSIHLKSADPAAHPAIRFNFLSQDLDCRTLIDGMRLCRAIADAPAMAGMRGAEVAPGKDVQSDDELLDWARGAAETAFHPVGTCKMGSDAMAVVDAELRVHGIAGLRVADASIMPTLVSGNTNAAAIMIGEKASDMVLAAAR
jgi:choline dehydrogenase